MVMMHALLARYPLAKGQTTPSAGAGLPGDGSTSWFMPWSDLMMTMFILFVVLFAFAVKDRPVPQVFAPEADRAVAARLSRQGGDGLLDVPAGLSLNLENLSRTLSRRLAKYGEEVRVSHQPGVGVVVSLSGPRFFAPGRFELPADARPVLDILAEVLFLARTQVLITGFAERVAEAGHEEARPDPWRLAALRASGVAAYFSAERGLGADMFLVQAMGALKPVLPETSEDNRRANRRLEIVITTIPL
jgi:chemotaxis protein MotB